MKLYINSRSDPDNPQFGYGDEFFLYREAELMRGKCSTCPNSFSVTSGLSWKEKYGWIATGEYKGLWIDHIKYGKCILINDGKEVPSRVSNPVHGGKPVLTELFIHTGSYGSKNPLWRGSRGCITIAPWQWKKFMSFFKVGDTVEIVINKGIDMSKLRNKIMTKRCEIKSKLRIVLEEVKDKPLTEKVLEHVAVTAQGAAAPVFDKKINAQKGSKASVDAGIALVITGVITALAKSVIPADMMSPELENGIAVSIGGMVSLVVANIKKRIENRRKTQ